MMFYPREMPLTSIHQRAVSSIGGRRLILFSLFGERQLASDDKTNVDTRFFNFWFVILCFDRFLVLYWFMVRQFLCVNDQNCPCLRYLKKDFYLLKIGERLAVYFTRLNQIFLLLLPKHTFEIFMASPFCFIMLLDGSLCQFLIKKLHIFFTSNSITRY